MGRTPATISKRALAATYGQIIIHTNIEPDTISIKTILSPLDFLFQLPNSIEKKRKKFFVEKDAIPIFTVNKKRNSYRVISID